MLGKGIADKLHVQLQGVDGQGGEHVQGRVTRAEIVHLHLETKLAQRLDRLDDLVGVLRIGRLRDFKQHILRRQIKLPQKRCECVDKAGVEHVHPRHVYRHRHAKAETVFPVPQPGGGLPPDELVKSLDEAVCLKKRDKHTRTHHAELRVAPAHQGLSAGEHGGFLADIELGLIPDLKLPLVNGGMEILNQLLVKEFLFVQGLIVKTDGVAEASAHRVGGDLCPVEASLDIQGFVNIFVHAHTQADTAARSVVALKAVGCSVQDGAVIPAVGTIDHEGIRLAPTHNAALFPHHIAHPLANAAQDGITAGGSEALVDHAEVVDVDDDGIHGRFPVVLVELFTVAVEILPAVKPREHIAFGREDDLSVFDEFNGTKHPGSNHIRLGVRLGDKVDGAEGKALRLRSMVGGNDDDGDLRNGGVLLFYAQKLNAIHTRHHQIQQHHGKRLGMAAHHLQRLQAVAGIEQLVIFLQYMAQQLTIDPFVFGNQNLSLTVGRVKFFMAFKHFVFLRVLAKGTIILILAYHIFQCFTSRNAIFTGYFEKRLMIPVFKIKAAPRISGALSFSYSSSFFSSAGGSAAGGSSAGASGSVGASASAGVSPASA